MSHAKTNCHLRGSCTGLSETNVAPGLGRGIAMHKRLLWISGIAVGGTSLLWVVMLLLARPPIPGITPENFKRLYAGMSEEEAIAILGRKPRPGGRMTHHHLDNWDESDCQVHLDTCDIWTPNFGPQGPTLSHGHMRLADGTTLELRPEPEHLPLYYRIKRSFAQVGLK
jgi:hypothetical protein